MNRSKHFDFIEERLNILAFRISQRGKLNILNLNLHSENFYRDFLNILFKWDLENLNKAKHNIGSIDLIDRAKKYIVQVSATNTKEKVSRSLKKLNSKSYLDYTFKFVSISKDVTALRRNKFDVPKGITFNPTEDIYDISSLLREFDNLKIDEQKSIYEFIQKELPNNVDIVKLDLNLSTVINILSKENLDINVTNIDLNDFDIERKIDFNELHDTKSIINDYSLHYTRLDNIYCEFDKNGVNKSRSVLHQIRNIYIFLCSESTQKNSDWIFLEIVKRVKELITNSPNFVHIAHEELDLCVNIIVVDAFVRCKIFKNPNNYKYVTSRQHTP